MQSDYNDNEILCHYEDNQARNIEMDYEPRNEKIKRLPSKMKSVSDHHKHLLPLTKHEKLCHQRLVVTGNKDCCIYVLCLIE